MPRFIVFPDIHCRISGKTFESRRTSYGIGIPTSAPGGFLTFRIPDMGDDFCFGSSDLELFLQFLLEQDLQPRDSRGQPQAISSNAFRQKPFPLKDATRTALLRHW
jgi:hypothetical protein